MTGVTPANVGAETFIKWLLPKLNFIAPPGKSLKTLKFSPTKKKHNEFSFHE